MADYKYSIYLDCQSYKLDIPTKFMQVNMSLIITPQFKPSDNDTCSYPRRVHP